jgi:hypothetical protein
MSPVRYRRAIPGCYPFMETGKPGEVNYFRSDRVLAKYGPLADEFVARRYT